jgi:hypothetical protein
MRLGIRDTTSQNGLPEVSTACGCTAKTLTVNPLFSMLSSLGVAGSDESGVEGTWFFRFLASFSLCASVAIVVNTMMLTPAITAAARLPFVTNGWWTC